LLRDLKIFLFKIKRAKIRMTRTKKLINFINATPNWEQIMKEHHIRVTRDGAYIMLKYDIDVDWSWELAHACRGIIIKQVDNQYKVVCLPFEKFFNYGEQYAATIDWNNSRIQEKVVGALIKVWWDHIWHISTNGMIDAFKAPTSLLSGAGSFGDLFMKIWNNRISFVYLETKHTYLFELVSSAIPSVIQYNKEELYFIGETDNETLIECLIHVRILPFPKPKLYTAYESLSSLLSEVNESSDSDKEGYVVMDMVTGNRIKIKYAEYLRQNYLIQEKFSIAFIADLILDEQVDDVYAVTNSINKQKIDVVQKTLDALIKRAYEEEEQAANKIKDGMSVKEIADIITAIKPVLPTYLHHKYKGKDEDIMTYIKNPVNRHKIHELLRNMIKKTIQRGLWAKVE
jgi:hypothetical protein